MFNFIIDFFLTEAYLSTFQCEPGAKIVDICRFGDEIIDKRCSEIFKNKSKTTGKVPLKGVAFPVCISVNETVCHCSPLESETDLVSTYLLHVINAVRRRSKTRKQ